MDSTTKVRKYVTRDFLSIFNQFGAKPPILAFLAVISRVLLSFGKLSNPQKSWHCQKLMDEFVRLGVHFHKSGLASFRCPYINVFLRDLAETFWLDLL